MEKFYKNAYNLKNLLTKYTKLSKKYICNIPHLQLGF